MNKVNQKRILLIAAIIVLTVVFTAGISFAWFVQFRTSVVVVTGDASISVTGEFAIFNEAEWLELKTGDTSALTDDEIIAARWAKIDEQTENNTLNEVKWSGLSKDTLNVFDENPSGNKIEANDYIAFKFRVVNKSDRNAVLSTLFSDFSGNIFENFMDVRTFMSGKSGTVEDELHALLPTAAPRSNIEESAIKNTAKLALIVDRACYTDYSTAPDGEITSIPSSAPRYLWEYSSGLTSYSAGGKYLDGISVPAKVAPDAEGKAVNVYFLFAKNFNAAATENYKNWVKGPYGQDRCAQMLGFASYGNLTAANKSLVDGYLAYFCERESRLAGGGSDDITIIPPLYLELDYFEFLGENAVV